MAELRPSDLQLLLTLADRVARLERSDRRQTWDVRDGAGVLRTRVGLQADGAFDFRKWTGGGVLLDPEPAATAHAALTTSAHGGIVSSADARLSDARPALYDAVGNYGFLPATAGGAVTTYTSIGSVDMNISRPSVLFAFWSTDYLTTILGSIIWLRFNLSLPAGVGGATLYETIMQPAAANLYQPCALVGSWQVPATNPARLAVEYKLNGAGQNAYINYGVNSYVSVVALPYA